MLGRWLPVAAYAALIFGLSSISSLGPPINASHIDKAAHFLEYGVLGMLLARALSASLPGRPAWVVLGLVALIGMATGAMDELYQGTRGRETSLADWSADVVGLVTCSYLYLRFRVRAPRAASP